MALKQSRYAQYTNASVVGNAEIRAQGRSRRVTAYGQGPDFAQAFNMQVTTGLFLPDDDPRNPRAYAVLGAKVHTELFGDVNPRCFTASRRIAFPGYRRDGTQR